MLFLKLLVELLTVHPNSGTAEDSANSKKHYSYIRKEGQAALKIVIHFRVVIKGKGFFGEKNEMHTKNDKYNTPQQG